MSVEKINNTHGRYGAVKLNNPKNDICVAAFLRPHTYTIMNVRLVPKNCTLTKGANAVSSVPPNNNM